MNKPPLLTNAEAELAWHFSAQNGNSYHSSWARESRVQLTERDLILLQAQRDTDIKWYETKGD